YNNRVLAAYVVNVREQRAGRVFQYTDARGLRDVLECAVTEIAKKKVWQPGRLANVKVIETVAIDIPCGNSIVPVDIDAARTIEWGAPMVCAGNQLVCERTVSSENSRS